jgi:acetylglutamate/LysW-gamma-L-alpha-aminoadipate kinase
VIRDDRSGTVERVNAPLLRMLLESGYVPVLSPPALSPDGPINVDADRASALVASALGADRLVLLTNVPGLLRDPADPTTLVQHVRGEAELEAALELAASRMRIKLLAARAALRGGVVRVVIADGRRDRPISRALTGEGTIVVGESKPATESRTV